MSPSPEAPDRLHLLLYDYVEDVLERRTPYRDGHLTHATRWREEGKLVMGGAIGDPPHGGVLVFRVGDADEVEAFAREDPYVQNGVVTSYRVEPWTVVV
jgi:uncharacterized protein YciI